MVALSLLLHLLFIAKFSCTFADPIIDEQIKWLRSKGGFVSDKIVQGQYGMFAASPIKKDEEIIVVPAASLISGGTGDMCDTAEVIAKEYALGDKSDYAPYVRYVFNSFPHHQLPTAWSDKAKGLFRFLIGSELNPQGFAQGSYEEICGEGASILKRAVLTLYHYFYADDVGTLDAAYRIVIARGWQDVLVPVYDLFDHRNGYYHNVDQANSAHDEKDISVVALRDIEEGEQLYLSYNECHDIDCEGTAFSYTMPSLFNDYGFVEQYPQRFNFDSADGSELVFEIDVKNDERMLSWLSDPPNLYATNWLVGHLRRMRELESTVMDEVEQLQRHEKVSIIDFSFLIF